MLSHDPGVAASTTDSILPFARSGGRRLAHGGVGGGGAGYGIDRGESLPCCTDLDPSSVVEAHRHATQAEELRRDGRLPEALQEHLEASHCFLEAAERLHNLHSLTGAALVLLSDGHARQAKTLQRLLRKGDSSTPTSAAIPKSTPRPTSMPPPPPTPKGLAAEGSMYSSTMMSSTASLAGASAAAGTAAVDDMLALERALQAIGSQPLFSSGIYQSSGGAGVPHGGPGGRYLSSTLGDSFFLVSNRHAAAREAATVNWEGGNSMMSSTSRPTAGGGGIPSRGGAAAGLRAGVQGGSSLPPRAVAESSRASRHGATPASSSATSQSSASSSSSLSSSRSPASVPLASGTSSSSSSGGGGGGGASGGFLEGVEAIQQGEVMRLLGCMKTLGDENAMLIKQVEDGARVRQENERLRREMAEFQEQYGKRFRDLRAALEEFRQKYPHEANPTNHVASARETARIKSLETEVESLMLRLNKEKEAGRKKDAMIAKYVAWYNKLRQSVVHKKSGAGGGGDRSGNHQQQQQQQQYPQQQRVGGTRAGSGSSSSSSSSSIRPPQAR